MKVTPLDIRRKEFRRSVRGYLDEDVDVFLDAVADEIERLSRLNAELHEKVRNLEEQVAGHAETREALEKTLVAAQLQSEEIKSKAEQESQAMLQEAEAKAKIVVHEFNERTQAVQQTLMQLRLLEEDFRLKFKALLEGYLQVLDQQAPLVSMASSGTGSAGAVTESNPAVQQPPSLPGPVTPVPEVDSETSDSPVYFGRRDEDPDDPFPEIGGDAAAPRDFAW